MAGLGAYGGAGLAGGLMGAGEAGIGQAAAKAGESSYYGAVNNGIAEEVAGKTFQDSVASRMAENTPWESLKAGAGGLGEASGRNTFIDAMGGMKGLGMAGAAAASPFMLSQTDANTTTKMPGSPTDIAHLRYNSRATTPEERAAMGRSGEQQYFTGPGYELMDTKTYPAAAGGMTPSEMRPANITPEQFRNMYFGGVDTATKAPKGKSSFNDGGIPWGLNRGEQLTPEQYAERYLSGSGNGNPNSPPDPFVRDPGVMQQYFTQDPPVVEDVVEEEEEDIPVVPLILPSGEGSVAAGRDSLSGFEGAPGPGGFTEVNDQNNAVGRGTGVLGLLGLDPGVSSTSVQAQANAAGQMDAQAAENAAQSQAAAQLGFDPSSMSDFGGFGAGNASDVGDASVSGANSEDSHGQDGNNGGDGGDTGQGDTGEGDGSDGQVAQGGLIGLAKGGGLASGSFVIPADVLSAAGNGSTKAGLAAINTQLMGRKAGGATLINGKGDGLSDSIPTHIDGRKPARVADGEAYIDPRTVTRLGGGDAKKGAAKLYSMMDKIRKQAHGKKTQQRPVNMARALA